MGVSTCTAVYCNLYAQADAIECSCKQNKGVMGQQYKPVHSGFHSSQAIQIQWHWLEFILKDANESDR